MTVRDIRPVPVGAASGPPAPTSALVADTLIGPGPAVDCPAAPLLAGELRRRGVTAVRGPLPLPSPGGQGEDSAALAVLLRATGGPAGLGVAADTGARHHARTALAAWLAATGERRILLASPRSFCAGVERAIETVESLLTRESGPIYVRRQIVHNTHVVSDLQTRGAVFVDELDTVPDGATVVFSAHGVSPELHAEADRRGLRVVDATCPLVTKVHIEARRFAARGDTVFLIGHAGHEEVEGTMGEAPAQTVLVERVEDVDGLVVPDPHRVSYLTQTTLAVDETAEVIDALRARFPALRGPASDDICYATTNRQEALKDVADEAGLILVIGSDNSSNSRRLVELSHRRGVPAHLIDDTGDIRPEWLAGVDSVGLTAGASAPPYLVAEVVHALGGLGPVTVVERAAPPENVRFTLPTAAR
ncbi:4-hydroxy-3-methylbut-2-enyl diphosphate reductase [Rhizohabitans arisaemae]|uniref:4-hydroxy-3-methylbut-2-enyl diphosphate reductase n=1 Tax=Rhizohabitans arisaemae TaxID=2720610 RepID=UPI0024B07246|nr:4-hydroxy-3-methylbut-2-enyl diphosphate reductase [Rhizohabitans arisaemae]